MGLPRDPRAWIRTVNPQVVSAIARYVRAHNGSNCYGGVIGEGAQPHFRFQGPEGSTVCRYVRRGGPKKADVIIGPYRRKPDFNDRKLTSGPLDELLAEVLTLHRRVLDP